MRTGILFIISAPSGAGKTSLVKQLVSQDPLLRVSISHTTRAKRPGETEGVNYFFVTQTDFLALKNQGAFLESASVHEHFYGTGKDFVNQQLANGFDIVLEIDWQGAAQIRNTYKNQAVSIFILPPSYQILQKRLLARQQDSLQVIEQRLKAATAEIQHYADFDYLIVNDKFTQACADLQAIVNAERLRRERASLVFEKLLNQLLHATVSS